MPSAEIVIAEDTLALANQREVSSVILRIVKNVDEDFSAGFNTQLQALFPFRCHRYNRFGKMGCDLTPNQGFKLVELLFRVHGLRFRFRVVKFLYGGQQVGLFQMPGFPLHEVAFNLVRATLRNVVSLPRHGKLGERHPILGLKAARVVLHSRSCDSRRSRVTFSSLVSRSSPGANASRTRTSFWLTVTIGMATPFSDANLTPEQHLVKKSAPRRVSLLFPHPWRESLS